MSFCRFGHHSRKVWLCNYGFEMSATRPLVLQQRDEALLNTPQREEGQELSQSSTMEARQKP